MIWFKEKNEGNAVTLSRLFDAETDHFGPTLKGSIKFASDFVAFLLFATSKRQEMRRISEKFASCDTCI